jgi:hypothetical protein
VITAVIGTIVGSRRGSTTLSPSIAESTEIAGVIMLSPKNSEDAAFTVVVGAQDQHDVLERDDDRQRGPRRGAGPVQNRRRDSWSGLEPVAHSGLGEEVVRSRRVGFEFAP